jgi:hypothetical protein
MAATAAIYPSVFPLYQILSKKLSFPDWQGFLINFHHPEDPSFN